MAEVHVAPELIRQQIFVKADVDIVGASFKDGVVIFEIEGSDLPKGAKRVDCVVTQTHLTVEFRPVD